MSAGCVLKFWPPSGIAIHGCLLRVQKCTVGCWKASRERARRAPGAGRLSGGPGCRRSARRLDGLCAEVGRDPDQIRRSAQLRFDPARPEALVGEFERWHEAGFTELVAYVGGTDPVPAAEAAARALEPVLASRV